MKRLCCWIGLAFALSACGAEDVEAPTEVATTSGDPGTGGGQTAGAGGSGGAPTTTGGGAGEVMGSGEFSALCYNVHGLPAVITNDDTAGRMTGIAPLLNSFDVVALQEDFMPENHAILESAATHAGKLWFDAKVDTTRVYGAGLTVFANPVELEHHDEHYTACNGVFDAKNDCLSSKGFQLVRLELASGVEVDVYNTHLDAGGSNGDDAAREAQVDQLLASLGSRSASRAVIVMGDTNLEEDDPDEAPTLARLLADAGLSDACDAVGCAEPGRIERILFRGGDAVDLGVVSWTNEPAFDNGGEPLSDHPAVSATFAWTQR
jgi:endonuclease/exonuclease/phosphatase family metal-dependent hydrolase